MLAAGAALGPYKIVALLGVGGMGEVYRAHDTRLGRDVAIKVLSPRLAATPEARARFEREARTISQLNHPHICTLHDIGHQDGTDYLVMELLEGETLAHRLGKGPLPVAEVLSFGVQIADALDRAHHAGVVHRDLKPGNVMLTKDGVKLMDFGLARTARGAGDSGSSAVSDALGESQTATSPITSEGMIVGTFQYMAPEQLEGKEADARTDLWALGCVLYEMATGKRAFDGTSQASLISSIMKDEPRPIGDLRPLTPPVLEHAVKGCLEKDPDRRWQSARDVKHELKWISETGSQTDVPRLVAAAPRRGRRLAWLGPVILGVAIGAAVTISVTMRRARPRPATFTPKTFQLHAIFRARFAPDGQSIVFSAAAEGNTPELYSVRPEYTAPNPLGLRGVHLLAVSTSGELAVLTGARYMAHCVYTGTLARVPLGAQAPRDVLENVRDADWSPDGSALAIIREVSGEDRLEYPIGKVLFESAGYLSDLRFSPRGDRIAFFEHPFRWDDRGSVKVLNLAGRVAELSSGHPAEEGLAWSPDGKRIYFSAADFSFNFAVHAVSLSGKEHVVYEGASSLKILDISRQGHWLAARDDIRVGIMVRPPASDADRDMSWLDNSVRPTLSADGRTVLFTEQGGDRNVDYMVCLRKNQDSPVVRLGEGTGQQLSPDGRWALAFIPTTPMQPVLYPTGAGEPVKLARGGIEAYENSGEWFPDGTRIVLCGVEPGKGWRVYVQTIPGGKPQPITPEGTRLGGLSPDGKLVLARSSDGSWVLYPVDGGSPRVVPGLAPQEDVIRWSADGRSVYLFDPRDVPLRVERFTFADGQRDLGMLLGTENRTGLISVFTPSMADDPRVYAYSYYRMLSTLYVVEGAR